MIKANEGTIIMSGPINVITIELTHILSSYYRETSELFSKEKADRLLSEIGRTAINKKSDENLDELLEILVECVEDAS